MSVKFLRNIFLSLIVTASAVACHYPGYYEKRVEVPSFAWSSSFHPDFEFEVKDTNSLYDIFVVLRHEDNYDFNNIWLQVETIAPGDTVRNQKLNLKLGDNKRWLGTEMGEVIEDRIKINPVPVNLKSGLYTFRLSNAMREDPLHHIINVGMRVEKVQD